MIYLLYGDQELMIKKRINKIAKDELGDVDEINFTTFDASETPLFNIIDDASLMPLGYDKRVVVITHSFFFEKDFKLNKAVKEHFEPAYEELIKFVSNPLEGLIIIFTCLSASINKDSELYKVIDSNGKILEFLIPNDNEWVNYVKQYFKIRLNVQIDEDAVDELLNRINKDLGIFVNEADKLALYSDHITYNDVVTLIRKPLEQNVFQIFDSLMKGNNKQAIKIFRDLQVEETTEPAALIATMINQLQIMYQVSYLTRRGKDSLEISKELGISESRVRMNKKYTYAMSLERVHKVMDELYELDSNIKSGQSIDRLYDFEMFLVRFTLQ